MPRRESAPQHTSVEEDKRDDRIDQWQQGRSGDIKFSVIQDAFCSSTGDDNYSIVK